MAAQSSNKADSKQRFAVALQRLIYFAAIGCLLIIFYGLRSGAVSFFGVVSVGMMTGGAALLSGGLLGFLFGVPHSQGREREQLDKDAGGNARERESDNPHGPTMGYKPNTSLEQISDWLTKIFVGVGLVEIKVIPGKLTAAAAYVAKGIGGGEDAEAFALSIMVYFSVCGFVFGFLWARLYLVRWFREGDEVQMLGEKISNLEKQHQADANALALITRQISRGADDLAAADEEVAAVIKAASRPVRSQIFAMAERTSANKVADDYDVKIQSVISILKGLIASDTADRYHRNHSELAHAFNRQVPPDPQAAESEITKAIEIRDRRRLKGLKSYEFYRARCRIVKDEDYMQNRPSKPDIVDQIKADLWAAYSDTAKWGKWLSNDPDVLQWMSLNAVTETELGQA